MKIALLGGSFNPPHVGHQLACLYLLEAEGFERVWMVPCFRHAFSKQLIDFDQRIAMCGLCARPFAGRVVVSEVEKVAGAGEVNRTVDTLAYLEAHYPQDEFWLVIGSDILAEVEAWKDFDLIRKDHAILVLARSGHPVSGGNWRVTPAEFPAISSTTIRDRLAGGRTAAGMLPRSVLEYIEANGLYGAAG